NPLLLRKTAGAISRVVIRNRDEPIDNLSVEDFRNEAGTDTLNLMRASFSPGENRRVSRLDGEHLQRVKLLFDGFTGARGCSAGTDADDQSIEFVAARVENLFCSRFSMNFRISRILELLGHEVPGILPDKFFRFIDRALHCLVAWGQHDLRAIG